MRDFEVCFLFMRAYICSFITWTKYRLVFVFIADRPSIQAEYLIVADLFVSRFGTEIK